MSETTTVPDLREMLREAGPGEWRAVCVQEWTNAWMVHDETDEPVTPGWFAADDASLIVAAVNALPQLLAAIEAVQELHHPEHRLESRPGVMTLTRGVHPNGGPRHTTCAHCRKYWPCPTADALSGTTTAGASS